ncbi:MAG: prenyltransferase/squalene oxidase repeat-containing protein [Planctomycetota bacterium]
MFRQASLILGAIVLIAGVHYCPSVCNALDDVKAGPNKESEQLAPDQFDKFDIGGIEETPPAELMVDPTLESPAKAAPTPVYHDDSKVLEHQGDEPAIGPRPKSKDNEGFGGRGSGSRKAMVASGGGTKRTERTVTAALIWLANHQMSDGSWSLQNYTQRCKDKSCTGKGLVSADAGATALGLLPFLAAGQSHKSKGPYREHILQGVQWLIAHQQPDGNLAKGVPQMMYSHGLATIALSEAFGLSGDKHIGEAAQKAVNFILAAQNATDGGWRYNPKDPGDTSVLGWQLTALKSAKMAGLNVGGNAFVNAGKFLDSVAIHDGTEYGYTPGIGSSPTMTAVGLLGRQYLGTKRDNPMLAGGMKYLMNHLPDESLPNVYYWYYATQVMRNMNGYEWDTWNRKMRDILVRTQVRNVDSCANGSWDPEKDVWGRSGGRVMKTSLSVLPLMLYYHWMPLFKAEPAGNDSTVAKPK